MKINNRKTNFSRKIKNIFMRMSNLQIILCVYFLATLTGAIMLILPISIQDGQDVSFIDAIFTSASAFSDTGLTTTPTVTTWTEFGQFIIAILILVGGIGFFALKFYFINIVFRKAISLTSRNTLEKERGSNNIGELKKTLKTSITFLFISIIIATFILWIIFYFEEGNFIWTNGDGQIQDFQKYNPKGDVLKSFKFAVFHSISAINNAGFDIISNSSLHPYYGSYSIQIVFIILLVIGGVGFPVLYDIVQYVINKIKRRTDFNFSLFTKISCITYVIVFVFGLFFTLLFEIGSSNGIWNNENAGNYSQKMMCIFFHVFSTRNAGFTTLDTSIVKFTNPTLIVFCILMFIGSAPSSTAGGIRTTTLAVIYLTIWNKLRGIKNIRVFKRTINKETAFSSFAVLSVSISIVLLVSLISSTSFNNMWGSLPYNDFTFADIFFETCSAFGTTGLSTGVTPYLNIVSKIFIILTMFIGQLGISSTLLVWRKNNKKDKHSYIEEDILIG